MASYLQPIPRVSLSEEEAERAIPPEHDRSPAAAATTPALPRLQTGGAIGEVPPRDAGSAITEKSPLTTSLLLGKENERATVTDSHGHGTGDASAISPAKPLPTYPAETWAGNGDERMPELGSARGHRSMRSAVRRSALDWIVPRTDELGAVIKDVRDRTVRDRLDPTLITARVARESYIFKSKMTGYALNAAIGMQVLIGALTTGLSVVTTGKQTSIMTAILGGFSTIVASYLARARGSNEPENSLAKIKDLEQFIRDMEAFRLDNGHISGEEHDAQIARFRKRFEELLGNVNSEKHQVTTPPA